MTKVAIERGTEAKASDGNRYRWLGAQWGMIAKSGKTSRMAKRVIGQELTQKALSSRTLSKRTKAKKSAAWFKKKVGESAKGFRIKTKLMPGKL